MFCIDIFQNGGHTPIPPMTIVIFATLYICVTNNCREREILHVQQTAKKIIPFLASKKELQSGAIRTLLTDIVSGAILQPVVDLIADPDIINFILEVAFNDEPTRIFDPPSGSKVEFLSNFVSKSTSTTTMTSTLKMDLSAILKNREALFALIDYLKEDGRINLLQFCLAVEDFNKRIMVPELDEADLKSLHTEALDLYKLYLRPTAQHKVRVDHGLVQEISKILAGSSKDVVQLRTTTPLFRAYEEVYNKLEAVCPAFYKSEQYFTFLVGKRSQEQQSDLAEKYR